MKEAGWTDIDLDFEFVCAYNTFVEISKFTMNTFKEIMKLREKHTDDVVFREKLIEKKHLCKDYLLSVNWAYKFYNSDLGFSLLLNFENITEKKYNKDNAVMTINYNYSTIDDRYKLDQKTMDDMLKSIMTDYNNKTDIIEKQQVLENKKTEIMKDYLKSLSIGIKDNYEKNVKVVFNAIAMLQGSTIKIEYVAESGYFKNDTIHKSIAYDTNKQKKFIENHKNNQFYAKESLMKIDIAHIHTPQNIMSICMLTMLQQNHINNLTEFADQYVKTLMNCIKEKHEIEITKYFNILLKRNVNKDTLKCMQELKLYCMHDMNSIDCYLKEIENMDTIKKLETYYDYAIVKYYKCVYRNMYNGIRKMNKIYQYPADNVSRIETKTNEILKSHSGESNFFKKIIDIIRLSEKIQDDMGNIVVDNQHTEETFTKTVSTQNLKHEIETMLSEEANNANTNITGKNNEITKSKLLELDGGLGSQPPSGDSWATLD
ncbi:hypothetical protein BDAP_000455 [Binucleata daphniae]